MRISRFVRLALLSIAFGPALGTAQAQQDVSGIWAGTLEVAPDTTLSIHFVLSRAADGSYSAVVTSPDTGAIKDVPASSVAFDANRLTLTVDELSGSYAGTWENGGFSGEWQQQGSTLPLRLEPYSAPVLSQAAMDLLAGSWVGTIQGPAGSASIVYRFEFDESGDFVGYLDSPEEGARGIAIENIRFEDGRLSLRIPRAFVDYSGAVAGDRIEGTWSQAGREVAVAFTRGEYQMPEAKLSAEAIERLTGSWVGKMDSPAGTLTMVFRFERNDAGAFVGFLDSPDQGARGIPMTEIEVMGNDLRLVIPGVRGEYTATLSDGRMDGSFKQGPLDRPLTLEPGAYTPARTPLDLSAAAMSELGGAWRGRLGPNDIVVRFETADDGTYVGLFDVPAGGVNGLSLTSASLDNGQVEFAIAPLRVEYKATLAGGAMTGQWQQGPGNVVPVSLTRD
jgi:hypothetical protein